MSAAEGLSDYYKKRSNLVLDNNCVNNILIVSQETFDTFEYSYHLVDE